MKLKIIFILKIVKYCKNRSLLAQFSLGISLSLQIETSRYRNKQPQESMSYFYLLQV